ncbi:MAG TPA: hypothetical protein VJ747_11945 [Stellaceae bacterium]|nr:hypothetical protein [Stellaceae bacterium]
MMPLTTPADAESALSELGLLIEKLTALLAEETALVRAGQIRNAAAMAPAKQDLTGRLLTAGERVKAHAKALRAAAPARCAALQGVQDTFRAVVQKNMIVLATAHGVSEGIVRRLSGEMARKAAPQVYGASGRATAPNPRHARPLAISKTL